MSVFGTFVRAIQYVACILYFTYNTAIDVHPSRHNNCVHVYISLKCIVHAVCRIWAAHTYTNNKNVSRINTLAIYTVCAWTCVYVSHCYMHGVFRSERVRLKLWHTELHTFNCALIHTYWIHIQRSIVQLPVMHSFKPWTQSYVSKFTACYVTSSI